MPNTSAPALTVVDDASTYQRINNTVDTQGILRTSIEQFKTQRVSARTALISALAKDLEAASLNVDIASAKLEAFNKNDEALAAKIKSAEELKEIFEKQIDDLTKTQPYLMQTVLNAKIAELEAEVKVEHEQTELVREQIKFLRSLLHDVNASTKKPA